MKKVIVCGPPHSGKSVFLANVKELLPRTGYFMFRCCPDGEGTWSAKADQETVKEIRRKGKFDKTFMDYVLKGLDNIQSHIPLVLVDVGGIRSAENAEIFKRCDYFIVLSSKEDEIVEWIKFGTEHGLKPLAILKSELVGTECLECEEVPVRGTVTNLERGTYQLESKLLGALASRLNEIITNEKGDTPMETTNTVLTVDGIAAQIGKAKEERKLPNGQDVMQMCWRGDDLCSLAEKVYNGISATPGKYVLDGPAPAWMGLAFVHGCHPQAVCLNDPRLGPVEIVGRKPSYTTEGEGKNLKFTVNETEDFTLVEFEIVGGTFDVADLEAVRAPKANQMKGIVLSGRGPNWLVAQIGMAYHTTRWVACWQPGQGATVAMTHHPERKLGELISDELVKNARLLGLNRVLLTDQVEVNQDHHSL